MVLIVLFLFLIFIIFLIILDCGFCILRNGIVFVVFNCGGFCILFGICFIGCGNGWVGLGMYLGGFFFFDIFIMIGIVFGIGVLFGFRLRRCFFFLWRDFICFLFFFRKFIIWVYGEVKGLVVEESRVRVLYLFLRVEVISWGEILCLLCLKVLWIMVFIGGGVGLVGFVGGMYSDGLLVMEGRGMSEVVWRRVL